MSLSAVDMGTQYEGVHYEYQAPIRHRNDVVTGRIKRFSRAGLGIFVKNVWRH